VKSNILLQGPYGSGKTTAIRTLLPEYVDDTGTVRRGAGRITAILSLDPGTAQVLGPNLCKSPDPHSGIHVRYVKPVSLDWAGFARWMTLANQNSLDSLLKITDPGKRQMTQMLEVIETCGHFVCDRCGADLGDAAAWPDTHAFVLDNLTPLTTVARHMIVGLKPILSQPEYNPIIQAIETFLNMFWGGMDCSAILLSHISREPDEITGGSRIYASTIGNKMASERMPNMPDEIILSSVSDRGEFTWATVVPGMALKTRKMPRGSDLRPDFSLYNLFE
jgi:hypothetical protein